MKSWILVILLCVSVGYGATLTGPATYYADGGVTGLTIKFVDCDSCSGTPTTGVTINGGVLGHTLSATTKAGVYWKEIPVGCYHVFRGGVWDAKTEVACWDTVAAKFAAIDSNNWVTAARIAADAVGASELQSSSVTTSELQDGQVKQEDVAAGNIHWAHWSANIKGSSPDTLFTVEEMQDSLRAIMGNWTAGDLALGELDSLVNELIGTSFSSAACSLTVTGVASGVRARWWMNSAANYDAVRSYEIYVGEDSYVHGAGTLDSLGYANLNGTMERYATVYSPRRSVQTQFVAWLDTCYVCIVATDYAGTRVSSGVKWGISGYISPGFVTDMSGNPYYAAGQNMADVLTVMGNELATAKAEAATAVRSPVVVFSRRTQAAAGVTQDAAALPIDTVIVLYAAATKYVGRFDVERFSGYTQAELVLNARMQAISEKGYLELDIGGQVVTVGVGGYGLGADTTWTDYTGTVGLTGLTAGATYDGKIRGYVGSSGDTLKVRRCLVKLK